MNRANINTLSKENIFYNIALTLVPGIGPMTAKTLIAYCGSPEQIFKTKRSQLLRIPGIGEALADALVHHDIFERAGEEVAFIEEKQIRVLGLSDDDYPQRLKLCIDAPIVLYYSGNADLNTEKIMGIVGTRNATDCGKMICEELVETIQGENILVVSGLAYGIDIAAHKACVKRNIPTVGVMGHGLDRMYPPAHKETAKKMVQQGGLLTEFMSCTIPDRQNFPKRNRIVAGMIDVLVVVETADDGGAMITAMLADSYNKDVVAYPGDVRNKYARGCNHLIKTNRAALVENGRDILELLNWTKKQIAPKPQRELFIELSEEEKIIYDVLKQFDELGIDELSASVRLTPSVLAGSLLNMEFQGLVSALPGKRYKLM